MWQRKNSERKPLTVDQLRSKAEAYCAAAEHCPSEVREKLFSWGADEEQIDPIIDYLIDENFISEERYCAAFVSDKIRLQSWGKEKIRFALAEKRLPSDLVSEALDAFPDDDYMTILKALIAKKASELEGEDDESFQSKMLRYLMGKGFSFSDIQSALADM